MTNGHGEKSKFGPAEWIGLVTLIVTVAGTGAVCYSKLNVLEERVGNTIRSVDKLSDEVKEQKAEIGRLILKE